MKFTVSALLVIATFAGVSSGDALAQDAQNYVYTPPPQQPAPITNAAPQQRAPQQPLLVAPIPFGALYNIISGKQPPAPGQQQPLTPYNTTP